MERKRILIVEDEFLVSDLLYNILINENFVNSIDIADSGKEAITRISNKNYDFISLDYNLPGNYSGLDIYTYIRIMKHEIPILFISGNPEIRSLVEKLKNDDDKVEFLGKPLRCNDYLNQIKLMLYL